MSENNSSSHKDVENKLDKYKIINKQIIKKLTEKRKEITNLKRLLFTSARVNVQNECRKWKSKVLKIRNMHMDQTLSTRSKVKSNAAKMKNKLDECIADMDQFLGTPAPASFKNTKQHPKKTKEPRKELLLKVLERSLRVMQQEHVVGNVSNNHSSEEKADVDGESQKNVENGGENREHLDGLHIFFHSDGENKGVLNKMKTKK